MLNKIKLKFFYSINQLLISLIINQKKSINKIKGTNVLITSFYNRHVDDKVKEAQKSVFNALGYKVVQIKAENISHGDFLNIVSKTCNDADLILFFDIDCIPLNKEALHIVVDQVSNGNTIAGAAQTANHFKNPDNLYVGPFFLGISTQVIKKLAYPDFRDCDGYDPAQKITEIALKNDVEVIYWFPSFIETPKWQLYHPVFKSFGPGTTYENKIYHAFESRLGGNNRFINKCEFVLKNLSR